MACTVPNDRCSVCGAIRKSPGDSGECDHIKYSLGKIAEDGTQIGTYNDEPKWFDISFVGRPADRIAWNLKVASDMSDRLAINSSVKQAEIEGYVLPDDLAIESDGAKRKLSIMKKLASAYESLRSWMAGTKPVTRSERYRYELRKLAGSALPDGVVESLREYDPATAFRALGDAGIVMNARSFFKYAFGPDYDKVEKYVSAVESKVPEVVCKAVKEASCAKFCNWSKYDAETDGMFSRPVRRSIMEAMFKSAAARGFGLDDPVSSILEAMASESDIVKKASVDAEAENGVSSTTSTKLAEKYAMYKLAGIDAVLNGACGASLNGDDLVAVAAAQDLKGKTA
jgi:hypothetical protein